MLKPKFLTFTGLDARIDVERIVHLSRLYPIEWGVLFSTNHTESRNRFPVPRHALTISRLPAAYPEVRLAAHLCGRYAAAVVDGIPQLDLLDNLEPGAFKRIQVNTRSSLVIPGTIAAFAARYGARGILQCRDGFPTSTAVDWLEDRSGGRGKLPQAWPTPFPDRFVGYAGGLGPDTIERALVEIQQVLFDDNSFWLDMESGIRTDDWLDLNKVEAVCRTVYGDLTPQVPSITTETSMDTDTLEAPVEAQTADQPAPLPAQPAFITFTGLDAETDLDRVFALSGRYPIEWGILFYPKKQGQEAIYPRLDEITRIAMTLRRNGVVLAAHLCGGHSKAIAECSTVRALEAIPKGTFRRIQVNYANVSLHSAARDAEVMAKRAATYAHEQRAERAILQCQKVFPADDPDQMLTMDPDTTNARAARTDMNPLVNVVGCVSVFPADKSVSWLQDGSAGNGISPPSWLPSREPARLIGYAGGIGPDNVVEALRGISAGLHPMTPFWIDMQSKIRTDGKLDLDKCEAVCRAVYGEGGVSINDDTGAVDRDLPAKATLRDMGSDLVHDLYEAARPLADIPSALLAGERAEAPTSRFVHIAVADLVRLDKATRALAADVHRAQAEGRSPGDPTKADVTITREDAEVVALPLALVLDAAKPLVETMARYDCFRTGDPDASDDTTIIVRRGDLRQLRVAAEAVSDSVSPDLMRTAASLKAAMMVHEADALNAARESLIAQIKAKPAETAPEKPVDRTIRRGITVRSVVTGLTGIVINRETFLTGTVHWVVQPRSEHGIILPDPWSFDAEVLEWVDDGVAHRASPIDFYTIKLGQKVKDRVTGTKGHITRIVEMFNGCVQAVVEVKRKKDRGMRPNRIMVDHKRLKVLGEGLSQAAAKPVPSTPTGCTHERVAREAVIRST